MTKKKSLFIKSLLIFISFIFFIGCAFGGNKVLENQSLNESINTLADNYISIKGNVGLVIGIINGDNSEIYGFGKINNDSDEKPDGDTIFEIGSITKVFTTTILSDMVKDGLVKLDDPIQKYLGDLVHVPKSNKEITFKDLATHTSGLPANPDNLSQYTVDESNPFADYTEDNLYEFLNNYKIGSQIGVKYEYSNTAMGLLGHILSLKAGVPYEQLVVDRICSKLGMNDTVITLSPEQRKRLAQGYSENGEPVSNWDFKVLAGAGALRSSANDMVKFLSVNMGLNETDLVDVMKDCHQIYMSDGFSYIGLGWIKTPLDASKYVIWHNGGTGGYRSFIGFVEGTKTGIVALSNSTYQVDDMAIQILKKLNN